VHTVLERGAVTHQMQAKARSLALSADLGIGQTDLRHQVAAGEFGQHIGIDAVGLAGQRGEPLDPLGVRDTDVEAVQFELVVDEPGPIHRLDSCQSRSS
jgi:hypothetical protein